MSTPAEVATSLLGESGASGTPVTATPVTGTGNGPATGTTTPNPGATVAPSSGGIFSWLGSSPGNVGFILLGAALMIGALLISQKETVVDIAGKAAEVAA